jgi:molybdate transport system regulatory protein
MLPSSEDVTPQTGPLKLKAQIIVADEIAMGPGKADLLEAIDREGSISAAGRSLGMSYRRTWELVDTMNRCWSERLVEAVAGGGRNRGARLTDFGRTILQRYRTIEKQLLTAAGAGPLEDLSALLRDPPAPRAY